MPEITQTPIQSELDNFSDLQTYDLFARLNLEFVYDGLVDFNIIKPSDGIRITET